MKFVNLTPHNIVVLPPEVGTEIVFVPSGTIARCSVATQKVAELDEGIPLVKSVFGEPQGIPEPEEGTMYIVSSLVASAARRSDVVSPDTGPTAVRENGQIVAVRGFQTFV